MMPNLLLFSEATTMSSGDAAHPVSTGLTIFFGLILVAMIAALAFEEKLHAKKSIIVGTFAGLCMILGVLTGLIGESAEESELPVYVQFIDWGVITIILGASLFVEVTSRSGVFTWMAITLTRKSAGDPFRLLIFYGVLTVFFSAVLNNVTAMIIIGSLTTVSLKKLGRTDLMLGFLLTEGLLTNVGGLLTLISSVPNIIVGKVAGITFTKFFLVASPYVLVATAATLLMARWRFGIKALKTDEEKEEARRLVEGFDATESVPSQKFFWFSVAALVAFIGCLAGQSALPFGLSRLDMGFIALFFAGVVLLAYRHEVDKFYAAVDWDLLAFFAGLFVVIHILEHAQVLAVLGSGISRLLQLPSGVNSMGLTVSSAVASSVTDNIPLSAVLARVLSNLQTSGDSPFWWCVIFGANLGGNLTPIGSASTVVTMTIIHRQKLDLTFLGFVKAAAPFAVMQIVLAMVYVLIAV
ncbi:MAG: hypothetical protein KDA96_06050 [Planctomycetaceae bacterium]|nr:hypothetical protein [Planctomycetaceae bacterium]